MMSELRTKRLNTNAEITLNLETETAINPIPLTLKKIFHSLDF